MEKAVQQTVQNIRVNRMAVVDVEHIVFAFSGNATIINDVTFSADKSEFVSIIGPSGCGKSTLLRIMAGLIKPTSGRVMYHGREITHPVNGISFVFQDFGLLPWLTSTENVKLGLSLMTISEEKKEKRARLLLDKIGLHGFEDSYPNVLSGGMKQRVGLARAIVSDPQVLLMDEPFSSVDELTADALRSDVVDMLKNKKISVSSVIMVTHNVEEAVELSDKIVVLSDKPAVIKKIISVEIKYPRSRRSKEFMDAADNVYAALTG